MNALEIATVTVAVTSALALWLSWRANARSARNEKKSNEIQEQLLRIEEGREAQREAVERRASLVLALEEYFSSGGRRDWRLRLENRGQCEAKEVNVTLNGKSIFEIGCVLVKKCPIVVGPGASWTCALAICSGFVPPWDAEATWQDESGEIGRYRTTLAI